MDFFLNCILFFKRLQIIHSFNLIALKVTIWTCATDCVNGAAVLIEISQCTLLDSSAIRWLKRYTLHYLWMFSIIFFFCTFKLSSN